MSLKVIGAGWGRTGTASLKKALEQLGLGPCYHMFELIKEGHKVVYWEQLHRGEKPDYHDLFNGYQSAVDLPAFLYYQELMQEYPEAKVILTVRDPEKWYESACNTIFRKPPAVAFGAVRLFGLFSSRLRYLPRVFKFAETAGLKGILQGRAHNKDFVISVFNQWNETVKKTVPSHKLLVYQVKDGWEPLCQFLKVPVPDAPFPKSNDSADFQKSSKLINIIKGPSA